MEPFEKSPFEADAREILSVAQLNRRVAGVLDRQFSSLWVRGEISNFTAAASGHWYFTLKDAQAAARGVMFRSKAMLVGFRPREGDQVEVRAKVGLYEPRGDYQLQVDAMRKAGQGSLYETFLRRKEALMAEGVFDAERKRIPPALPRRIGVITSLQAAALRDVLTALTRRAPHVEIIVYPAPVQGEDAPRQLIGALQRANQRDEVDTLLLVRGGGSIEDLWAFNDADLARTVAASALPVIVGVGHETDFTLADFAADVRAPTPTAAAELACTPRQQSWRQLEQLAQALVRAQWHALDRWSQRLDRAAMCLESPGDRLRRQREQLSGLAHRLRQCGQGQALQRRQRLVWLDGRLRRMLPDTARLQGRLDTLVQRLRTAQRYQHQHTGRRLQQLQAQLQALGPRQTLARGYAIARDAQGKVVRDAQTLETGQTLTLTLLNGERDVQVQERGGA